MADYIEQLRKLEPTRKLEFVAFDHLKTRDDIRGFWSQYVKYMKSLGYNAETSRANLVFGLGMLEGYQGATINLWTACLSKEWNAIAKTTIANAPYNQ